MKASSFGRAQISAEVLQRLLEAEAARDASIGEAARAADQVADVSLRLSNASQRRVAGRILSPIDGTVVKMAQAARGKPCGQRTTRQNLSDQHGQSHRNGGRRD